MTPGRLIYLIRSQYRDGFATAYYRDRVRRRILNTRPCQGTTSKECEIHVLTSGGDWLNLIWALKTFYHYSGRRYSLCIHEDGSLPEEALAQLRKHFPDARLISRSAADAAVLPALSGHPLAQALRRSNVLSLKVFDSRHYLESGRMLLVDSDILFFREPGVLLSRIESASYRLNTFNADISSAYTVDPAEAEQRLGFALRPLVNSGLALIHRDSLDLDLIERALHLPNVLSHSWRIEQTLFALLSSKFGLELLPDEYRVRLAPGSGGLPCRHYIGQIRHLMYREGMKTLNERGFLRELGAN